MQRRLIYVLASSIAMLGIASLSVVSVGARSAPPGVTWLSGGSNQTNPAPPTAPGTYAGKVTSNTNSGLTIHGNDGDHTVVVQPGAAISRDGKTAAVSDLKNGDNVTMTVAQNGVVQTINATSKKSSGFNPAWLLLLLLLIPLVLLLWWLSRRKKNDFFVQPDTARTETSRTGDDFTVEQNRGSRGTPRA